MPEQDENRQYDDRDLERIMRDGLTTRAEGAPDRLDSSTTEAGSRRGSRHRRAWVVGTAAAVVLLAGIPAALRLASDPDPRRGGAEETVANGPDRGDWRVESYGGVQVRVPPDWGWGGAPMPDHAGGERPLDCGVAPFVVPGSDDYEFVPQDTPYVGRPVMMTDACALIGLPNAPAAPAPTADSVWLGVAVEPGLVELGNGYVRETVVVGDSVVTVTSDDPELRAAILDTAEVVDVDANGCATETDWASVPDALRTDDFEPVSLSVCAYTTRRGQTTLLWSQRRDARDAGDYFGAIRLWSANYDPFRVCSERPDGEWLAIGVHGEDESTDWSAVTMSDCAQILRFSRGAGGPESAATSPVSPQTVAPWASSWTRAYLAGPQGWDHEGAGKGMLRGYLG